ALLPRDLEPPSIDRASPREGRLRERHVPRHARAAGGVPMSAKKRAKAEPAGGEKAQRTRAHILESALALFRKRGFDKTTMRDVAAAAGVALGAAYYYFPSKEALVLAYYNETQAAHAARARERLEGARTIPERVAAVMHAKLDVLAKDRK